MYSISSRQVNHPTKVVWPTVLFSNSEHFLYDICVGHWPANTVWWQAKASDFMRFYI